MSFFDVEELKKKKGGDGGNKKKRAGKDGDEIQSFVLEQLENWAEIMRSEIEIKDYRNGWFGTYPKCAIGQDIYGWIIEHAEEDKKKGAIICQKMVEKKLIFAADETMGRIFNINNYYRFHMDRDDIADNLIKKWKGTPGDALEVSINLVNLATEVYQQAMVEDEEEDEENEEEEDDEEGNTIDVEAALKSSEYKSYINAVAELEKVQVYGLPEHTRKAVLLNCYQCMYVHHFLKKV